MFCRLALTTTLCVLLLETHVPAETIVHFDVQTNRRATPAFQFPQIRGPVQNDAGSTGVWTVVSGQQDRAGGEPKKLSDGYLPLNRDQPSQNFFFAAGTEGGRLVLDLKRSVDIQRINSYSWHVAERAPQVYSLFASDGSGADFQLQPGHDTDLLSCGWTAVAEVDTRPDSGAVGGQYGVRISSSEAAIGRYRYLLFDIAATQPGNRFSNTFFSEIDVVAANDRVVPAEPFPTEGIKSFPIEGGKYQVSIDTSETPDLSNWAHRQLVPVVQLWYPKIVDLLASEGYQAPRAMQIRFSESMGGVAATSGTNVSCSVAWFRRNLQGEAKGAIVHELVHVVQQYADAQRTNPRATRTPGWIVEGIADYIRWHLYEPASKRGGVSRRRPSEMRYNASYRETASFLAWVVANGNPELIAKLNAAARNGSYTDDFWKETTGETAQRLALGWQQQESNESGNPSR